MINILYHWDSHHMLIDPKYHELNRLIDRALESDIFFVLNPEEINLAHQWQSSGALDRLQAGIKNGLRVKLLVCDEEPNLTLPGWRIVTWPLYHLYRTAYFVDPNQGQFTDLSYLFLALNRRSVEHRCYFIDQMFRQGLDQFGRFSWHMTETTEWQYWTDPRPVELDQSSNLNFDQWSVPKEFYQSLFSVVGESFISLPLISEKTAMCIWLEKPFLVYGHPELNNRLKSWGFRTYDEFFKMKIDTQDEIISALWSIRDCNYSQLRQELEPIVQHNKARMREIVNSQEWIPDEMIEYLKYCKTAKITYSQQAQHIKMFQHLDI